MGNVRDASESGAPVRGVAAAHGARAMAMPDVAPARAVVLSAAASLAFRLLLIARYRFDSDETQHLHVAWAWAHGLVQYRDVFDNHMPLFHMLFAPLVRLAGERPSTLFAARLAMLPLFALMGWLTDRIGRTCLSPRNALLATLIGLLAPDFFLCSIEFRTDVLWAASWLACIALLVRPRLTSGSAAAAGLALGIAGATSAKTSLLAASLVAAAIATIAITRIEWRSRLAIGFVFAIAASLPSVLIAAFYRSIGAWAPFFYCTVQHNLVASGRPSRLLAIPIATLLIFAGTRSVLRGGAPSDVLRRRVFVFLTASIYGAALIAFWPVMETEHWLPFYPIASVGFAPFLLEGGRRRLVASALIAASILWMLRASTPWVDHASESLAVIDDAMRLTSDSDRVVDVKGEIVFRTRASYWVFEKLTKRAVSSGRIPDTMIDDILRTGAMVAVADNKSFPQRGRDFLTRNFISVGCVRVAGKLVHTGEPFAIEVPGDYALISDTGETNGVIDGLPYAGPRGLSAGTHLLTSTGTTGRHAVIWRRAFERGFSPFAPDTRCAARSAEGPPRGQTRHPSAGARVEHDFVHHLFAADSKQRPVRNPAG